MSNTKTAIPNGKADLDLLDVVEAGIDAEGDAFLYQRVLLLLLLLLLVLLLIILLLLL